MTKTFFGICPSFTYSSPLPLFSNLIRRAKAFEAFTAQGAPTGELSPLRPDGYPVNDGRLHGVRLFSGEGETPRFTLLHGSEGLTLRQTANGLTVAYTTEWKPGAFVRFAK